MSDTPTEAQTPETATPPEAVAPAPTPEATPTPAAETPVAEKSPAVASETAAAKPAAVPPVAEKAAEAPAAKPAPPEPVFNTDELQSSTARYTYKAWHLYNNNRKDMTFIRQTPLRATLEARTPAGAEELQKLLTEAGVQSISRSDKLLSLTGTFEMIQTVIRHPQTFMLDAVKL